MTIPVTTHGPKQNKLGPEHTGSIYVDLNQESGNEGILWATHIFNNGTEEEPNVWTFHEISLQCHGTHSTTITLNSSRSLEEIAQAFMKAAVAQAQLSSKP